MDAALVNVKKLTVKVGRRILLNDINWTVEPGQQWVVFGMNGSGKTTLLSAIAGYRHYSQGSISLFGEKVTEENILSMRKRVGLVSSSFFDNYYRNESAIEIILAGKTGMLGIDDSIDETDVGRAKDWLARFDLLEKADMPFCTLSKGQRQNVLLIRALFNEPEILILDEPCSGLDIDAREHVLDLVREIAREGKTAVIYVTHYTEELLDVFTHAIILKKGRAFAKGTMEECFGAETLGRLLERPVSVTRDEDGRMRVHFLNEAARAGAGEAAGDTSQGADDRDVAEGAPSVDDEKQGGIS